MTRIDKWQNYREEIAQSSFVGSFIYNQTNNLKSFEDEINKINPSILQNISNNENIIDSVLEIDTSNNKITDEICSMFKNIDTIEKSSSGNIFVALKNLENDCIIDNKFSIKKQFLDNDKKYTNLQKFIIDKKVIQNNDAYINQNLKGKYESLSKTKSNAKISPIKVFETSQAKKKGIIFKLLFGVSAIFALISIILLIIRTKHLNTEIIFL